MLKRKKTQLLLQLLLQSNFSFTGYKKSRIERCGFFCVRSSSIVPAANNADKISKEVS
jgi:hypothetical protein